MIVVDLMRVTFEDLNYNMSDIPKIRGYFAQKYKDNTLFHNHIGDKFDYRYPQIQFRIIDHCPTLLGINNGIDILKNIVFDEKELIINNNKEQINEKRMVLKREFLGSDEADHHYEFISPWMALKEENYKIYIQLDTIEKNLFLNHLLRENLKSLSKGFDYFIPNIDAIQVKGQFSPIKVNFKNQKMLCFKGHFSVNFMIPDYLGLGKQSARGFGTVIRKGERE